MIVKVIPTRERDKPTYVRISSAFSSVLKMNTKTVTLQVTEEGCTPSTWTVQMYEKVPRQCCLVLVPSEINACMLSNIPTLVKTLLLVPLTNCIRTAK